MSENSYFNPNPVWMFTVLKIWCIIAVFAALFACYMVIFKSPPNQSLTFRRFIVYHIIGGMLFELQLTIFSPPLIYLPYIAGSSSGIWTQLGVSPDIQFAVLIHLVVCASGAVCPLFFYRMDCVIPKHHPFKKWWIQYVIYGCFYALGSILPVPLILLAIHYKTQLEWKMGLLETYKINYKDFLSPKVVVVGTESNPWATVIIVLILASCIAEVAVIFVCTITIYRTVEVSRKLISAKDRKDHIAVLTSLMPLVFNMSSVGIFIVPSLVFALMYNSPRAASAGGLFPVTCIAYVFSFRPYRRHILRVLMKKKVVSPNPIGQFARIQKKVVCREPIHVDS